MNTRVRDLIGRRSIILLLALIGVTVGLLWFNILRGVTIASADGGFQKGSQGHTVAQEYGQHRTSETASLPSPAGKASVWFSGVEL